MPYREPEQPSRNNTFADILAGLKLGLDAYSVYQTEANNERRIDMQGRQLQETTREHNAMLPIQQGQLDVQRGNLVETGRARAVAEEANRLASQKFQTENPQAQPWNMTNYMRIDSKMRLAGIPVDDIPFMNDLKTFAADPNMLRGDVANDVEMKWPEWSAQTADALTKRVSKLSDQAANLPENDPKRQEFLNQVEKTINAQKMLLSIPADKVKQMLFPDIYQHEQNQKAAIVEARAAIVEARAANQVELLTQKQGFQNDLLNQKFEHWKEMQGIKAQSAKELQDYKFDFLKQQKVAAFAANEFGRNLQAKGYQEQLRDVEKEIRDVVPLHFQSDEEYKAARAPLEQRRNEIMAELKELSGIPQTKPAGGGGAVPGKMPPGAQTGTYRGTRAYTTDGKTFFNMSGKRLN
jgi:hypothetical protein